MPEKWLTFLYQYGVGGIFFFSTLGLGLRSKALNLDSRFDRRLLAALALGYIGYLAVHAAWIRSVG